METGKFIIRIHPNNAAYIVFGTVIGFINLAFTSNPTIIYGSLVLQIFILFLYFITNRPEMYWKYYVTFVGLSLDSDVYLRGRPLYSLVYTQVLGISLAAVLIIPLIIMLNGKIVNAIITLKNHKRTNTILRLLTFGFLISIIIGAINILINDNSIRDFSNYWSLYFSQIYGVGFVVLFLICSCTLLIYDVDGSVAALFKKTIVQLLVIIGIDLILSSLFGITGMLDGLSNVIVSASSFYMPFLIMICFFDDDEINTKELLPVALILTIAQMLFASSAKSFFLIAFALIVFGSRLKATNKVFYWVVLIFAVLIGLFALNSNSIYETSTSGSISNEDWNKFLSFIQFWKPNWLMNMNISARCRIIELIDIFSEYIKKPIYLPFGKGFLGSFTEHSGLLTWMGHAFTDEQWANGVFYSPHETLNRIFLFNGLFGLATFIYVVKETLQNMSRNPWIIGGLIWFVFFWGFSIPLLVVGGTMFIFGFWESDIVEAD